MIGELFEIFKFIKGVVLGDYSYTFLSMIIILMFLIVICEVVYETKHTKVSNYVSLILEKIFWNILGIIFFLGMYMFIMRFLSNMNFIRISQNEIHLLGEMGMIAYICMVIQIPLSFVAFKTHHRHIKILSLCIQLIAVLFISIMMIFLLSISMISNPIFWLIHIFLCMIISNVLVRYNRGLNVN